METHLLFNLFIYKTFPSRWMGRQILLMEMKTNKTRFKNRFTLNFAVRVLENNFFQMQVDF